MTGSQSMNLPVPGNTLQLYLSQINRFPILDREEEHALAVRYYRYKDMDAAERLVTANLRFVVKIALEYKNYGVKLSDLIQEGNIGLMVAVKKFNPYKGYRLLTYAVWWIRSYMQDFILRGWSLVRRGSRSLRKKLFYQLNNTRKALSAMDRDTKETNGMENSVALSDSAWTMEGHDLSLDESIGGDNHTTYLDMVSDSSANQEEIIVREEERQIVKRDIAQALAALSDKERFVLKSRIMRDAPLSLQAIGESLGLTRERVRQIEVEALRKLRRRVSANSI